jgi:hypothetical protein
MKKLIITSEGQQEVDLTSQEIAARAQDAQKWEIEKVKREKQQKIKDLEDKITNRRLREAILRVDNGWLLDIEDKINKLRGS